MTFDVIYFLVDEIVQLSARVKANKARCHTLAKRGQAIAEKLKPFEQVEDKTHLDKDLISLASCLEEAKVFIDQFSGDKWYKRARKSKANGHKFEELNASIEAAIKDLALGVDIQQLMNREQDKADLQADNSELRVNQVEIMRLMEAELDAVHGLHDKQDELKVLIEKIEASILLGLSESTDDAPETILPRNVTPIAFCDISFKDVIRKAHAATTYQGTWLQKRVAVKALSGGFTAAEEKEFIREMRIMAELRHPNITQFYGACFEPGNACIVMEYMPRGSLHDVMTVSPLAPQKQKQIALDIAHGLQFLHTSSRRVIHCDLKSSNVLLGDDYRAKLTDFGFSNVSTASVTEAVGRSCDYPWMAPELLRLGGLPSEASDVYSFGTVLWELVTAQRPYTAFAANKSGLLRHLNDGHRETIPEHVPAIYRAMIESCWHVDPAQRPSLGDIIQALQGYAPDLSSDALYDNALRLERETRYGDARENLQAAADKGQLSAIAKLGSYCLIGRGGVADKEEARRLLTIAAEAGIGKAQKNLGQLYEYHDYGEASQLGKPTLEDLEQALMWYKSLSENTCIEKDKETEYKAFAISKLQRLNEKIEKHKLPASGPIYSVMGK